MTTMELAAEQGCSVYTVAVRTADGRVFEGEYIAETLEWAMEVAGREAGIREWAVREPGRWSNADGSAVAGAAALAAAAAA
jgi:hypothetical protein